MAIINDMIRDWRGTSQFSKP